MRYTLFDRQKDLIILIARILLMYLFVTSGWTKLTNFSMIEGYFASVGVPAPSIATIIAIVMEFFVGIALVVGFFTRPLAALMALFVLGTAFLGHHFWSMPEPDKTANMLHFYKNLSIMGGLLLLSVFGPGRFSIDKR
ncbi:DoxX family protein [Pseudomonas sp. RIT-To-2]|uniref:DoxX family protein n=1 Tax=Pseudomonas sp. RIT-To-2 TaxID=3462541 RepID=UPI0024135C95